MSEITVNSLLPYRQLMVDFRRDLHRHPEIGFEETRTSKRIAAFLREFNVDVYEGIGQTGVVAVLRQGTGNRSIMLRADMDALPITETSAHSYRSQNPGKMHACGHDGHTAMLLGAAKYLLDTKPFDGTVILVFQPNEEHGLGAQAMLDDDLIGRFQPNEVYAIHNLPGAAMGEFSTRVGNICASESLFEFEIVGHAGHSSMPQLGVDAILVGSTLVQALQTIVARKLPPAAGAVVSVTEFITDGQRNVLPGHVILKGDTRARTPEDRAMIESMMGQIATGISALHNVEVKFRFQTEFDETINSQAPTKAAIHAASSIGAQVLPDREPMSFSEDFGRFCAELPGCFMLMGNGMDYPHSQPLHSSDYDFNEDTLTIGAAYWARLVAEQLPRREPRNQ